MLKFLLGVEVKGASVRFGKHISITYKSSSSNIQ